MALEFHSSPKDHLLAPVLLITTCAISITQAALVTPPFSNMTPTAQITPSILSNVRYSPPVSTSLDWVPEEKRLIIDIWREVDENTWLLGDEMLLSRRSAPWVVGEDGCLCTWGDRDDPLSFYALLEAPFPLPPTSRPIRPLHDSSSIRLIYDAGGGRLGQHASAIWKIGDIYFKIKYTQWTLPAHMPREHTILDALHRQHLRAPLSFAYPKVLYHVEYKGRYYLVTTSVPGSTVRDAWPAMDEVARQRCAEKVASICRELTSWRSDQIGFVNGTLDTGWATWLGPGASFVYTTPEELIAKCKDLGMEVSDLSVATSRAQVANC